MWKSILSFMIRTLAPTLAEQAAGAIENKLNPLPPTDGTDFGEPAKVRRRRSLLELRADAQAHLDALVSTNITGLNDNELERLRQRIITQRGEVAKYEARIAALHKGTVD